MLTKDRIAELLQEQNSYLASEFGVRRIGLFGSASRNLSGESKAELIIENGQVVDIRYSSVRGRRPLGPTQMDDFRAVVEEFAEEIVKKWIDYFVLHKPVPSETITRKIG